MGMHFAPLQYVQYTFARCTTLYGLIKSSSSIALNPMMYSLMQALLNKGDLDGSALGGLSKWN